MQKMEWEKCNSTNAMGQMQMDKYNETNAM